MVVGRVDGIIRHGDDGVGGSGSSKGCCICGGAGQVVLVTTTPTGAAPFAGLVDNGKHVVMHGPADATAGVHNAIFASGIDYNSGAGARGDGRGARSRRQHLQRRNQRAIVPVCLHRAVALRQPRLPLGLFHDPACR